MGADEDARTIPQKELRLLAGRTANQLNNVAARYGVRCSGRQIDLGDLLRDLFDLVSKWGPRITALDAADPVNEGRRLDNERKAMELAHRRGELVDRAAFMQLLAGVAADSRATLDALERRFGPDATRIVNRAIDRAKRRLEDRTE